MKKWVKEIGYLRGFAILAVIMIHVTANFVHANKITLLVIGNIYLDTLSHFAVPLFIFISGFILSFNYNDKFSLKLFYKKRFISIIPPYIFFSIVYICFKYRNNLSLVSLSLIIKKIILAEGYYHLWFFSLIIQIYIFYPIIKKIYDYFKDKNKEKIVLIILFFLQLVWNIWHSNLDIIFSGFLYVLLTKLFLSHIFYFILGIFISDNFEYYKLKLKEISILKVILIALSFNIFNVFLAIKSYFYHIEFKILPHIFFMISDILAFIILVQLSVILSNKNKFFSIKLNELGKYSFGIYLIHALILEYIYIYLKYIKIKYIDWWLFYPLSFLIVLLGSYCFVYYVTYLPFSKYLIGQKRVNKHKELLSSP